MTIDNCLKKWITKYQPKHLVIAYSGGVDSTALLHLACRSSLKVVALHVNHRLSQKSDSWEQHCRKFAVQFGAAFYSKLLTPPVPKINIEHWARSERYRFFTEVVAKYPSSILFTAHHLEDQAETFLLNALRGSGIEGLAGIGADQALGAGHLIRPLLKYHKSALVDYCKGHQLSWVEDDSNLFEDYRRNVIRHQVMPVLYRIVPEAAKLIARSAGLCGESRLALKTALRHKLKAIQIERKVLNIPQLIALPVSEQKLLLKHWLNGLGVEISHKQLLHLISGISRKVSNRRYFVGGWVLRIDFDKLSADKAQLDKPSVEVDDKTVFNWLKQHAPEIKYDRDKMIIRRRRGDDRCRYPGRRHQQKVKVLFQELEISADMRDKARIICLKNAPEKIIALYPFFVCP